MSVNKRDIWEREIMDLLIEKLEITNGDAQGIFEAHTFEVSQELCLAKSSSEAAQRLINL
jgi:hypothetical protein